MNRLESCQTDDRRRDDSSRQVADCYAADERSLMEANQRWRGRVLRPLLTALDSSGMTPNSLTALSFLCGLAFCPLWMVSRTAALIALALHVLLDGLDGPLARHQGLASRRGSFTDTMSDQCVVTAVTVTLMADQVVGVVAGGAYVFLYALVVGFAMIRNALSIPYSWVVRPRFVVYAWLVVEVYAWPGSLDVILWIGNAVLACKMLTGFLRIRERI